jgi:hypothetical protein
VLTPTSDAKLASSIVGSHALGIGSVDAVFAPPTSSHDAGASAPAAVDAAYISGVSPAQANLWGGTADTDGSTNPLEWYLKDEGMPFAVDVADSRDTNMD